MAKRSASTPIGLRPTVKWAHEQLGIPQPQGGGAGRGLAPGEALPGGGGGLPRAAFSAQPPGTQTVPQLQADQLARSAAPAGAAWVDQIRALVDGAASLQDIRDGLEQLLPDMTLEQSAQAMAEALAAAQLAGRYEVLQEAGGIGG